MLLFYVIPCVLWRGVLGLYPERLILDLSPQLSNLSTISAPNSNISGRWSAYGAPQPGVVVSVGTEEDVAISVRYCVENGIQFLAQSGGHGWAQTFHLGSNGLLISLRRLNSVTFNGNKTQVTIGGGALISDLLSAAAGNDTLVVTGNCNCVGALGAVLGAGYGNMMGSHGFGVDNILSLNVVLANGQLHTITPADRNLFWALRGAGPNFGIVTSATMKAYPFSTISSRVAWSGRLVFHPEKVEAVVRGISALRLRPEMNIFLVLSTTGAPHYTPQPAVTVFYYGSESEGREAFTPILDIGPIEEQTAEVPYAQWNDWSAGFCVGGGYKSAYSAGINHLDPEAWRRTWEEYAAFASRNGTENSVIFIETYPMEKARSLPDSSSSFPWRSRVTFNAIAIAWYYDRRFESGADAWGRRLRDLWQESGGLDPPAAYVNFAHGDEGLRTIYGENVPRLQSIKEEVDPQNVFNQWFPLLDN